MSQPDSVILSGSVFTINGHDALDGGEFRLVDIDADRRDLARRGSRWGGGRQGGGRLGAGRPQVAEDPTPRPAVFVASKTRRRWMAHVQNQVNPDVVSGLPVPEALGWLLALRAGERLDGITHVRVSSHVAGPRGTWDRETRTRVATAIRHGAAAVVDGVMTTERVAERRWLAWFPRPVGPHHAVNVGGPSVALLADLPGIQLVRSHLTAVSWQAEVLQAAANLAGRRRGARLLDRWVEGGEGIDDADVRWACVIEATANDHHLVRAWSHGWGPQATSAVLADILDLPGRPPNERGQVRPREVLDEVASKCDMRWSITGPDVL